jgi:hypothetical protein
MILLEYLQSLPPETWGFLGAGGAGVITAILKFFSYYKAQQRKQLERVASVIAETIQGSIGDALERADNCRYDQIQKTKRILKNYSTVVCLSARNAVLQMLKCNDCEDVDLVTVLYGNAVSSSFLTDVMEYFEAEVIGKKWLIDDSEKKIEEDITRIRRDSFDVFLASYRGKLNHKKLQERSNWIEQNMDTVYMRDIVSSIVHSCRDTEIEYAKRAIENHRKLTDKIVADLSA